MAKKPENRYATPRALADDVERWMADEPVSAWREPVSLMARRWERRHRTLVTASLAAVLVALAGTAAVLVVQTQSKRALALTNGRLSTANDELERVQRPRGRAPRGPGAVRSGKEGGRGLLHWSERGCTPQAARAGGPPQPVATHGP